jgi:hypothetical protein
MDELERMAQEVDATAAQESPEEATDSPAQPSEVAEPTDEKKVSEVQGAKPNDSETDPSKSEDRERNPDGTFRPKDVKVQTVDPDKEKSKPETKFEQAKKEADRRDKTWKQIQAEKAAVRAEAAAIAQQRQELSAERQRQAEQARTSPDGRSQYTAQEYLNASADFKHQAAAVLEDNPEQAKKLLDLSDKAAAQAQQAYQAEASQYQEVERNKFAKTYDQTVAQEFEKNPELQDPANPIHGKLKTLLETEPIFQITADGFSKAHRVAQLLLAEESVSELKEKNKQLEAEVADLRKRTGIKGSGPTSQSSPKTLDQMTAGEQMAHLERLAAQHDGIAA